MTRTTRPRRPRRTTLQAALAAVVGLVAALLMTTPAHAAPEVTVGTFNTFKGNAQFRGFADVIGWQEVNDSKGHDKRRAMQGYSHFKPKAGDTAAANHIPISWRSAKFERTGSGSKLTHGGEAKVTPSRFVNWVVLKHKNTGKKFAFVNTHFISGAWSKHPDRQARWLKHRDVLKSVVKDLEAKGLPVAVVGDFNRKQTQGSFLGMYRFLTPQVPLDHLYASKGHRAKQNAERLEKWGSDVHYAWRAPFDV